MTTTVKYSPCQRLAEFGGSPSPRQAMEHTLLQAPSHSWTKSYHVMRKPNSDDTFHCQQSCSPIHRPQPNRCSSTTLSSKKKSKQLGVLSCPYVVDAMCVCEHGTRVTSIHEAGMAPRGMRATPLRPIRPTITGDVSAPSLRRHWCTCRRSSTAFHMPPKPSSVCLDVFLGHGRGDGTVGSSPTMAQVSAQGGRSSAHGKAVELFTHSLCPYAQRVEMALAEKEVQHEVVSIDLNRKPSWYRSVNPRMLVPALRWNGNVVVESLAICRYVDESFEGTPLMPDEAGLRDRAEELLGTCGVVVSAGLQAVKGKDGRYWGIGTKFDERDIQAFERNLAPLLEQLQEQGGPFLMGQQLTLADLAYLPFIERFTVVMDQFMGYSLRMLGGGKLGDWMDCCRDRPSLKGTWTDPVKLRKAYQKYMSLDFFDYHSLTRSDL